MAATRLSESQKLELVERFRAGESSQALADAFACSPNTVSRAVKAAMDPADYEQLKQQRARRGAARQEPVPAAVREPEQLPLAVLAVEPASAAAPASAPAAAVVEPEDQEDDSDDDAVTTLAIDDADDFGDDEDEAEEDDDLDDDDLVDDDDLDGGDDGFDAHDPFRPIPLAGLVQDLPLCEVQPLVGASLPASAWMLVDKVVELQPKPLREFPELGRLPDDELDRQAIAVYANPRQAKRHCGRTQRVIKVPDLGVLELTSPYLVAQGISRLVVEGALYSLPGS